MHRAEQSLPSRSAVAIEDHAELSPLEQPVVDTLEHRTADWHEATSSRDARSAASHGRAARPRRTRDRDDVRTSAGERREEIRDRRVHAAIDCTDPALVEWPYVDSRRTRVAARFDDISGLRRRQDHGRTAIAMHIALSQRPGCQSARCKESCGSLQRLCSSIGHVTRGIAPPCFEPMRIADTAVVDERRDRRVTNPVKSVAARRPASLFSRAAADADLHDDGYAARQIDRASIGGDEKTICHNSIPVYWCCRQSRTVECKKTARAIPWRTAPRGPGVCRNFG